MYREIQPFREALSEELKASLFPAVAGVDPDKLLETYLDRLTMYTGVDVADQTFTVLSTDAGREVLGSLEGCTNGCKSQKMVKCTNRESAHKLNFVIRKAVLC